MGTNMCLHAKSDEQHRHKSKHLEECSQQVQTNTSQMSPRLTYECLNWRTNIWVLCRYFLRMKELPLLKKTQLHWHFEGVTPFFYGLWSQRESCCGFHSEKECFLEEFVHLVFYIEIHISEVVKHLRDWVI